MPLNYEVLTWPDPRLRRVARPVERVDDEVRALVDDLFDTLAASGGVGLAAPQVGVDRRVVVLDCAGRLGEGERRPLALIDPEIVEREGHILWREGCLSLPGVTAEVERSAKIVVEHLDVHGARQRVELESLEAVCAQHELDHLDGTLYVDRLGELERAAVLREYEAKRAAPQVPA